MYKIPQGLKQVTNVWGYENGEWMTGQILGKNKFNKINV